MAKIVYSRASPAIYVLITQMTLSGTFKTSVVTASRATLNFFKLVINLTLMTWKNQSINLS